MTPPERDGAPAAAERWDGRRVLVTGAGGFIGSHLAEALLRRGASVRAFVRYNSRNDYGWLDTLDPAVAEALDVFRGDLANPEAVDRATAGRDVVLHLGALIPIPYSYRHPREFVTANVEGTFNVLEAARRHEVSRLVHTSTSEVYGTALRVPIDEEHPLRPQSPYAASKVAADSLALSFQRSFGTPVVVARPFNTFGPRQSARAIIPTIVSQALTRDAIELGATSPTRDFVYVADTVDGLLRCAMTPAVEGETFNLGTGREHSIAATVERILALLGRTLPVVESPDRLRPPNSEVERLVADGGKAERRLGWRPRVGFDDGLRETIEWLRDAVGAYKPTLYNV